MSQRSDRTFDRLRPEAPDHQSIHSSPTLLASPLSPFNNRPGYRRLSTAQEDEQEQEDYEEENIAYKQPHPSISELPEDDSVHGLRIRFSDHDEEALKIGATVVHNPDQPPSAAASLLSPSSSGHVRHASTGSSPYDDIWSHGRSSPSSMHRLDAPFSADTEEELLTVKRSKSTLKSFDTSRLQNDEPRCKTRRHFHHSRGTWLSITILVLSVYSTVLSGLWLGIAIARPRYGRYVTDNGNLPPASASLLCAAFAKTIELSFVTVFVTFLGQVLSHRAFVKQSRGVTISEMQMRSWVMQPGTMITHWQTLRHAAFSFLGVIALSAALVAMLYTTASDGLVAPKLKFGRLEDRKIYGSVATRFGYQTYLEANCKTPITNATDPDHYGQTCMAIVYSGQAYHNYAQWMSKWGETIDRGNGTLDQTMRTPPVGMLYDNTTIEGSWIEAQDITKVSRQFGRVVNNVTVAMPHTAVFAAARDPINRILQPQELDGLGEYFLEASVPSPATNVICAHMTQEELKPMVLELWPGWNGTKPNNTNYPALWDIPRHPSWLNKTAVDDVFGFGRKYGRRMPVFPKLPLPFNTVLNSTAVNPNYTTDSLYVLGASEDGSYALCSLRTYLTPNCSTTYHASLSGGTMRARCNDPRNPLSYHHSHPEATSGNYNIDWINVANQWAQTLSLGAGISDDYASNPRLLMQLLPTQDSLSPVLPTTAEALAVLAGSTLLLSGVDAPFLHYWNGSATKYVIDPPQYQAFNATIRSQDYSSGGTQKWQGIFYLVLLLVFFTNLFCLVYFLIHRGLVTDYIEPQNLFALAVNSPPSRVLEGSCGGGPEGTQLDTNWHIRLDMARDHFFIESAGDPSYAQQQEKRRRRPWFRHRAASADAAFTDGGEGQWGVGGPKPAQRRDTGGSALSGKQMQLERSPVAEMFQRFSRKRVSLL